MFPTFLTLGPGLELTVNISIIQASETVRLSKLGLLLFTGTGLEGGGHEGGGNEGGGHKRGGHEGGGH